MDRVGQPFRDGRLFSISCSLTTLVKVAGVMVTACL